MKKNVVILMAGLLAGGMLFATEANAQIEEGTEQQEQVVSPDIDLSSLTFKEAEVENLPDAVKEQLVSFEEEGAVLVEAWIAKTEEETIISKLLLAEGEENSVVYLDENGVVLKKEKLPVEDIEIPAEEPVEEEL